MTGSSDVKRKPGAQAGVALIAVLWIVAALSIAVTGLVRAQREEIRVVSAARQVLAARGAGDAAMHLVMQQIAAAGAPLGGMRRFPVSYAGRQIVVDAAPLNGWINPARAPEALLAAAFVVAGRLDAGRAAQLAQRVAASRDPSGAPAVQAPEDLLRIPGVDYELYARLAPLLSTDVDGSGRVNPLAAPKEVLLVLTQGDAAEAAKLAAGRDGTALQPDTTRLNPAYIDSTASSRLRLQARVPTADGRWLLLTRDVQMARRAPGAAPWRLLQAQETFEPASEPAN